jgi:hypothetical protein
MKNWKSWWMVALSAFLISWLGDWAFVTWFADEAWVASWGWEQKAWFGWETILAYAWFALALTFIFIKGYEGSDWWEGIRFGTYMWSIMLGGFWIAGIIPATDAWLWAVSLWVGFALVGWAMWWSYKPNTATA